MPKSVESLKGRGLRSTRMRSREEEDVPVGLPGSSCLLMVEYVAWDGYNRTTSQRTCSAPFGNAFRAGDPHGGSNMPFGNIQGCSKKKKKRKKKKKKKRRRRRPVEEEAGGGGGGRRRRWKRLPELGGKGEHPCVLPLTPKPASFGVLGWEGRT
ncbi:hypothetical protein Taro_033712, partial [Colocasia esculenta]|nr:hypothetical protein [Colocasia esculenta]